MADLKRAIHGAANRIQRRNREFIATLCDKDGNTTPDRDATVVNRPGYVYCTMPDGSVGKPYNGSRVPPVTGRRVWVGYEPRNPSLFRVLDIDASYAVLRDNSGIGPHHKTHEWMNPQGGNDATFMEARQLMPLRVSPAGGFTVRVESGPVQLGDSWDTSDDATLDLSGDQPATGSLYVLIYLDASNVLSKRVGTPVGIFATLGDTNIPAVGAGEHALAAVALYGGQTAILETQAQQDIRDLRFSAGGLLGLESPLTTKGDLWGFDTNDSRVPVGSDGDVLTADSGDPLGVSWQPASGGTDATTTAVGVVEIEQDPPSGHPVALTIIERNTPNGLAPVDTDQMLSSMSLPLIGGQATGAVTEASRWVRYASNPLFGGANASAAQEPNVLVEGGSFKMWYTSGWASPQINYATSADGLTWSQYGSNPVFATNNPCHSFVFKTDGVYWMYFVDCSTDDLYVTTSADGISWAAPTLIFAHNAFAWEVQWGNQYVWREGYTWQAIFEYRPAGPLPWQMSLFTSTDGLSWTLVTKPLSSLKPGGVGEAGGPFMNYGVQKRNGLYHLWYHGTSINATTPTDIYHATSPDLLTWTITNSGNPILTHTGSDPEVDQAADPVIVEWNNQTFMYFEGVNNAANYSKIEVLTWAGTLAQLVDEAAAAGGTVSSVGLTVPAEFSVGGSPVTGSGTLAVSKAVEPANTVWAGPTTGADDVPIFRALVAADMPAGIGTVYAPLVNGDTPGPTPIAADDGQYIMTPIS